MKEHAIEQALSVLKDLVAYHPNWGPGKVKYAACLASQAQVLLDQDKINEAQMAAKEALEFDNIQPNHHTALAKSVLNQIQERENAIREQERAIKEQERVLEQSKAQEAYNKEVAESRRQQEELERIREQEKEERIKKQNQRQQELAQEKANREASIQNITAQIEAKQNELVTLQSEFQSYMASSSPPETIMERSQAFQEDMVRIMEEINALTASQ